MKEMREDPNSDILKLLVNKDKKKKDDEKLSSSKVVLHFVNKEKENKYHIYVGDSQYGSYALAMELHKAGHYFIFFCKSDHPTELFKDLLQNDKLQKGEWT